MRDKAAILVVDSGDRILAFLSALFKGEGYGFAAAADLESARRELEAREYDVVIAEASLFRSEPARQLAWLEKAGGGVPVILLNEDGGPEPEAEGFFAVFPFPALAGALRTCLRQAFRMRQMEIELAALRKDVHYAGGLRDPETGLYTRAYAEERLFAEFRRASRYVLPLSLVFIAVDRSGHPEDLSWQHEFAGMLRHFLRSNDIAACMEDTQLMVVLPDTGKKGAELFALRVLEHFQLSGSSIAVTQLWIGVGNYPEDGVKSETALLDLAARAAGRAQKKKTSGIYSFPGITEPTLLGIRPGKRREVG